MGQHMTEQEVRDSIKGGVLIGETEPCRETKYTFWLVYAVRDGGVVAGVADDDNGVTSGERIEDGEIGSYVDDTGAAQAKLSEARAKFAADAAESEA